MDPTCQITMHPRACGEIPSQSVIFFEFSSAVECGGSVYWGHSKQRSVDLVVDMDIQRIFGDGDFGEKCEEILDQSWSQWTVEQVWRPEWPTLAFGSFVQLL